MNEELREVRTLTVERTFTTHPQRYIKRGCNTVRARCIDFIDMLKKTYPDRTRIPLQDAVDWFRLEMGIVNRVSVAAYFGVQPHRQVMKWRQDKHYATGTVSVSNIKRSRDVPGRDGYFELFGLGVVEGDDFVWNKNVLVAELGSPRYEGSCASNDKISISPIAPSPVALERNELERMECGEIAIPTLDLDNTHTTHRVRDINRSSESTQKRVGHTEYAWTAEDART